MLGAIYKVQPRSQSSYVYGKAKEVDDAAGAAAKEAYTATDEKMGQLHCKLRIRMGSL